MPWDGKSWISSFDHIENCSSSNPLSDYVYPQALLAPSPVSWFLPLLGLVESWSRNSRFFFPSFHIFGAYVKDLAVLASWIYMDGLISGWFVGTPILGHLHIHIYMYILNDWNHVQWPSKSQFIANGIMYWYVLDIQQKVIICVIIDT